MFKVDVSTSDKNMVLEICFITQDVDDFERFKREVHRFLERYACWAKNKKNTFQPWEGKTCL